MVYDFFFCEFKFPRGSNKASSSFKMYVFGMSFVSEDLASVLHSMTTS